MRARTGAGARAAGLVALAGVLLALSAARPAPLGAQEIGIYQSSGSSDLSELHAPRGIGFFGRVFPTSWLAIRGALYFQSEDARREGPVCDQYVGQLGCDDEEIRTESRLRGFAATAALRHRVLSFLELEGGGGLSLSQVDADEETASGRTSSLYLLKSNQAGWLLLATARIRPVERLPVTLEVGATHHRLLLRACAETHELQYDPFCQSTTVREIRIGLSYDVAW